MAFSRLCMLVVCGEVKRNHTFLESLSHGAFKMYLKLLNLISSNLQIIFDAMIAKQ
jgi:hypothetical protein